MTDSEFILSLTKEELDSLPYDVLKWQCCCKECKGFTTVRDYGIQPFFFLNRNSKSSNKNPSKYWMDTNKIVWLCSKHWDLDKKYGAKYVFDNYYDFHKVPSGIIKKLNQGLEKINT